MKVVILIFFLKNPFIYEVYEDSVLKKFFEEKIKKYEDTLNGEFLNIKVNSDQTPYLQNEEQIIVNPLNPNNLVAYFGYYVEQKISENFIRDKKFESKPLIFDISGRRLKEVEKPSIYLLKIGKETYKILKIRKGGLWKKLKF